jgi:hypothetical protein
MNGRRISGPRPWRFSLAAQLGSTRCARRGHETKKYIATKDALVKSPGAAASAIVDATLTNRPSGPDDGRLVQRGVRPLTNDIYSNYMALSRDILNNEIKGHPAEITSGQPL